MNNDEFNFTPDESFSVDSILAEFKAERALSSPPAELSHEDGQPAFSPREPAPEDEANHIVYDSREQAIGAMELNTQSPPKRPVHGGAHSYDHEPESGDAFVSYAQPEPDAATVFKNAVYRGEPSEERRTSPRKTREEPRDDYRGYTEEHISSELSDEEYAARASYEEEGGYSPEDEVREPDFRERILSPLLSLIASASLRRREKQENREKNRRVPEERQHPELRVDRAAGFYAAQAQTLRLRSFIASGLTIVLIYLSYGLPAFGLLGSSPSVRSLVCLIFELAVMVTGLDVVTNGLTSLFRMKPGAESLISVSCIVTAIDALVISLTGKTDVGLPFCGASALSVTLALWGGRLSCEAFAISFTTAARAHDPNVIMSLSGVDEDGCVLAKAHRPVTGFVRTAETADVFENAYRLIAPVLLAGSLILSLFCYFGSEKCTDFIHTLAACMAATASLSAVFGFAFPFWTLAKRLAKSGVAVAGYSGAAELGRLRRVMITDSDIFPARTLSIADVAMAEGARPGAVISCTGSIIAAAGLGVAPIFTELMRKNGCAMQKVEDFACHEGGGLVARVNGDQVYVGTASFMQLMGVRVPKDQAAAGSTVFTAINNSLAGIFTLNYKPVATVQRALVTLLRGKISPLFAIRDFNITPMLIKQKFRLPTKSYDFPSFADRYRVSSSETEDRGVVVAMFARGGLNSVSGLVGRGRKLYNLARVILVISLLGSICIPVLMLSFCWTGSFDSASCSNLMTFMLLWLLPVFIISLSLRR